MSRFGWIALLLAWSAAASWGLWKGLEYESTAAAVVAPPHRWPGRCGLVRDPQRYTLLMFIHPKCPCTRASICELDRLLACHRDRVIVRIIVLQPQLPSSDWEQSPLLAHIRLLPSTQLVSDQDGGYRRQFRASTSGECLLYNQGGQLVFHGGLTPFRGHEGPSTGQAALTAFFSDRAHSVHSAPVFGCALEAPTASPEVSP